MTAPFASAEFMDWLKCQEKAVDLTVWFLHDHLHIEDFDYGEQLARALLARFAQSEITVEWNREP